VEAALAVRVDGVDDAFGYTTLVVTVGERDRGRLPEAVVLEAGERTRGGLGGRAVDHAGLDPALVRAQPEVGVCR
jgi:hypothetical protein